MSAGRRAGIGAALALWAAAGAARADEGLPRYRLEPGLELRYEGEARSQQGAALHRDGQETTAWVVRRNEDGSVRVVVRHGTWYTQAARLDALKGLFGRGEKPAMDYVVGSFDLYPDGRIGPGADVGYRIITARLFPRLPDDAAQAGGGWTEVDDRLGQEFRHKGLEGGPNGWHFRGERLGMDKKVYGMENRLEYRLDGPRGFVRRIDERYNEYKSEAEGTGSIVLASEEQHDAAWMEAFAPAADAYFAAARTYNEATRAASEEGERAESLLAGAKAGLERAREAIEHPIFREQIDNLIARHDGMAGYHADNARRRAEVVGKAAADWELSDLDGKSHRLADYRGKVVVLDFWYRGCGWCVKAMPQMNELAERFGGRPVAILGMNTDADHADAKFVADAMGLKYGTLVGAKEIPEKYGVQGFPTLILIDPEGVVRDMHVGYSPTLRDDVAAKIERLLPKE